MCTICVYVCVHMLPWTSKDSYVSLIGLFHGHMSPGELWSPSLHSKDFLPGEPHPWPVFISLIEVKIHVIQNQP